MATAPVTNQEIANHPFLQKMYADNKFPKHLVDKGKAILLDLCYKIETRVPKTLPDFYDLTHRATDSFNDLQDEFKAKRSKYDQVASDSIGGDFTFIMQTYGFIEADAEELTAPKEW